MINILEKYATSNPCYASGKKITVEGGMLHSVGCPQPDPLVFAKNWNKSDAKACVHAVVGKDGVIYQILPWNYRGWHCGSGLKGSGNNNLVSIEMTEPASIMYTGGANWIEIGNGAVTKQHVLATYANAVKFFAHIMQLYRLDPEKDGVLISHREGHARGIASNHGDVEHIWSRFGLTMEQFRRDVKAAMNGGALDTVPSDPIDIESDDTGTQTVNPLEGSVTVIYDGADGLNLRKAPGFASEVIEVVFDGTYSVIGISADEKWYKLSNGLYVTAVPKYVRFHATERQKESTAGTGYYRVRKSWEDTGSEIGAFKDKDNAIGLCKQNSGYKVYYDGEEIYPLVFTTNAGGEFRFRVTIPNLRIRKGPGTTYDYRKKDGKPLYTGKGVFTIIRTQDGPGARIWGLLKSYGNDADGWISLDDEYGVRID